MSAPDEPTTLYDPTLTDPLLPTAAPGPDERWGFFMPEFWRDVLEGKSPPDSPIT